MIFLLLSCFRATVPDLMVGEPVCRRLAVHLCDDVLVCVRAVPSSGWFEPVRAHTWPMAVVPPGHCALEDHECLNEARAQATAWACAATQAR